jgi:uncharacterized delta-60 repeat protein
MKSSRPSCRKAITPTTVEPLEARRLLAVNDLDLRFSTDGWVTTNFNNGFDNAMALAIQKDGKVIVVGEAGTLGFVAVRFNADGTLDDGGLNDSTPGDHFGTGGKFTYSRAGTTHDEAHAVAIQKDGKIVIAGSAFSGTQQTWLILRLNPNGSFDTTFGFDHGVAGLALSTFNTPLTGMVLQNDGKIVVCGSANGDFLVGRFTTSGDLDNDFATGGTDTLDFGGTDAAGGVALDYLGRIVVAGVTGKNIAAARYLSDGSLDMNFGTSGKFIDQLTSNYTSTAVTGIVVGPDGVIHVSATLLGQIEGWVGSHFRIAPDGVKSPGIFWSASKHNGITLMANEEIAFAAIDVGRKQDESTFLTRIGDGIDKTLTFGATASAATAIAGAPDGSLFVAGIADFPGRRDFVLAKFVGVDPSTWGAISGNVYRDVDGDHVQDPNEKGMSNVRVYIDEDGNGKWGVSSISDDRERYVFTDSSGKFTFKNLRPGEKYVVREVAPGGTTQTNPSSLSYSVTVAGGKTVKGLVFSNKPLAAATTQTAIVGSVFNDWNGNARRDIVKPTEPDMPGSVVFIDSNKNGKLDTNESSAKADAGGNYTLKVARGGTYRVVVVRTKGWINTTPASYDVTVKTHAQATTRFGLSFADSNDTITEAKAAIAIGKSAAGTLAAAVDVNVYRITVSAGQTVGFDIDSPSSSSLNSLLRLFDAKKKLLASNDNGAGPAEGASVESYLKFKFTRAGTYFIAVSDHLNSAYSVTTGLGDVGTGTIGKYSLVVKLV